MPIEIKKCRVCFSTKLNDILDLGKQPPANSLHNNKKIQKTFPLKLLFCVNCSTAQLSVSLDPKFLFNNYYWVTGTSKTAKDHAKKFYKLTKKYINKNSKVLEIASNDGTFLRPFIKNKFRVLGVDPAKNISKKANADGIKTIADFFSEKLAKKIKRNHDISLIFARNVIPHVKNIHSVIKGISELCSNNSVVAIEFHYSKFILKELQYDSIYHEHLFYFSIKSISNLFSKYKLYPFDVFSSPISGGSLVLMFNKNFHFKKTNSLKRLINFEKKSKINSIKKWREFAKNSKNHAKKFKRDVLKSYKNNGKLFGYGASARSSTLLNYCNLNQEHFDFIIDQNPLKQNLYTPGTNIKILPFSKVENKIINKNMVLLAWNFKKEIINFMRKNKFKNKIILPIKKNENKKN